jgi:Holliday junction DNA helicase RuvB
MIGEGPSARSIRLDLSPFTLVGATTRVGLLGSPFRDRFGLIFRLNPYSEAELVSIIRRSGLIMGIPITPDGASEIAARSRGTPRIANRLLRRVGDLALVEGCQTIDRDLADRALTLLGIDQRGLDEIDRKILKVIVEDFGGGPVGLKTLSIAVGEDTRTIEDVYEPFLIQSGFLKRTPQGREATPAARGHLQGSWW